MKQSKYNILIREAQRNYIYNTCSLALAEIEDENIELLGTPQLLPEDTAKLLFRAGYLVDDNDNELDALIARNRISRFSGNILGLVIAPTLNCNLKCTYCFEEKRNSNMTENIIQNLVTFVNEKISQENISEVNVTWYGGEPLLGYKGIKRISKELQKICRDNKLRYTAGIITNGVLLDAEKALEIRKDFNITWAQITLDGPKEIHEKRRCSVNGEESFEQIIENIKNCIDVIDINLRINIDKDNKEYVIELLDELNRTTWFNKVKLNFAKVKGVRGKEYSQEEFADIEFELWNYMVQNQMRSFEEYEQVKIDTACASIGTNYYVIDPEGLLYTCWNEIGIKERSIGSLGALPNYNSNYTQWLLQEYSKKCKECIYLPLCQGGCPYEVIRNKENCCSIQALNLNRYIKKRIEIYNREN